MNDDEVQFRQEEGDSDSYLTLGDGDFTYSLDLCRYMHISKSCRLQCASSSEEDRASQGRENRCTQIVCTGIDSLEELQRKYRDVDFVLRNIRLLSCANGTDAKLSIKTNILEPSSKKSRVESKITTTNKKLSPNICISIHHGVNAIQPWSSISSKGRQVAEPSTRFAGSTFSHVIFNHPHLGTEDAALHSRFICHFFHSAVQKWLKPRGGVLHLTLVKGQCERWKCLESAESQGLVLLHRDTFRPPPPPGVYLNILLKDIDSSRSSLDEMTQLYSSKEDLTSRYHHRRHQSGRSFASRAREGSETLTFGRKEDSGVYVSRYLPWQKIKWDETETYGGVEGEIKSLKCPFCDKSFRDERARKNHIKCVHPHGQDSKIEKKPIVCNLCLNDEVAVTTKSPRIFSSLQALADHQRAKHCGSHTNVKPDWVHVRDAMTQDSESTSLPKDDRTSSLLANKSCEVCGLLFLDEKSEMQHFMDYFPRGSSTNSPNIPFTLEQELAFVCSFCSKRFREKRAQRQHENFCHFKKSCC